jgi:CRP-like cAMP-binding protein
VTDDLRAILQSYVKTLLPVDGNELDSIVENLRVATYPKGTRLVAQGEVASHCYFVLRGCLRTFHVTEGREHTAGFFVESETLTIVESYRHRRPSPFSVECLEDSTVILGTADEEDRLLRQAVGLGTILQRGLEETLNSQLGEQARFRAQSPEARYREFLGSRPGLAGRVAQHQLASFLGMTPESLSRIKRRLHHGSHP